MTTALVLVTAAYREANIIAMGDTPTADEQTEGLARLNGFLSSLFSYDVGGTQLSDWPTPPAETSPVFARYPRLPQKESLPSDVWPYPPQNVRLLASITTATTVYFPSAPSAGARMALANVGSTAAITLTLNGNGRKIGSAATFAVVPASMTAPLEWFYRDDLATWQPLASLAIGDESPLPATFDDLLIIGTAARLVTRHGRTLSAESTALFQDQMSKVRARYQTEQQMPSDYDRDLAVWQPFASGRGLFW